MNDLLVVLEADLKMLLREPLTVLLMVVMPLLAWPLVGIGFGALQHQRERSAAAETVRVAAPAPFRAQVQPSDHIEVVPGHLAADGELMAPAPQIEITVDGDDVTVRYRGDLAESRIARDRVRKVLRRWQRSDQEQRYARYHIPVRPADVVRVDSHDVSPQAARTGWMLGRFAPLLLAFLLAGGSTWTALDLFAGEKERGTIETLLTTRVNRRAAVAAKGLLVLVLGIVSGGLALLGLWCAVRLGWMALPGGDIEHHVPASALGWLALLLIPLAAQLSALAVVAATWAPDYKTGQIVAIPVLLLAVAPAAVSAIPAIEASAPLALVPLANVALLTRELLAGHATSGLGLLTAVATTVHVGLAVSAATWLVGRETLLVGEGAAPRYHGRFGRQALGLVALSLALVWFLGQLAQARDLLWGMVFTQVALIGGPALAVGPWLGQPTRHLLGLRRPRMPDLLLAVAAGVGAPGLSELVAEAWTAFVPVSKTWQQRFSGALDLDEPLVVLLLVFAVLPAICEETFFRGALLGLLRKSLRPIPRVVVVGLAFGLFHLSVARFGATAVLGMLLATAALRSESLGVPIAMHALHNGLVLWLSSGAIDLPEWTLWAGAVVAVLAVARMGRSARTTRGA